MPCSAAWAVRTSSRETGGRGFAGHSQRNRMTVRSAYETEQSLGKSDGAPEAGGVGGGRRGAALVAATRVHAVAVQFGLGRLPAVVAAVFGAGWHLAVAARVGALRPRIVGGLGHEGSLAFCGHHAALAGQTPPLRPAEPAAGGGPAAPSGLTLPRPFARLRHAMARRVISRISHGLRQRRSLLLSLPEPPRGAGSTAAVTQGLTATMRLTGFGPPAPGRAVVVSGAAADRARRIRPENV